MIKLIKPKILYIILFIILSTTIFLTYYFNYKVKNKPYTIPNTAINNSAENEVDIYEEKKDKEYLKLVEAYNNKKLLVLTFDDGPRKIYRKISI